MFLSSLAIAVLLSSNGGSKIYLEQPGASNSAQFDEYQDFKFYSRSNSKDKQSIQSNYESGEENIPHHPTSALSGQCTCVVSIIAPRLVTPSE